MRGFRKRTALAITQSTRFFLWLLLHKALGALRQSGIITCYLRPHCADMCQGRGSSPRYVACDASKKRGPRKGPRTTTNQEPVAWLTSHPPLTTDF